jgi:hypothetical protein
MIICRRGAFYAKEQESDTFFQVTQRDSGSIASSPWSAIFPDQRVHVQITLCSIKVSHDQCIIRTNMVASNRTVGQTSNDFIISGRHSIMHCKCTNAFWCCCSELTVYTNAEITVKCLLSDMFGTMHLYIYNALLSAALKLWNRCLFDRQFCLKPPYLYGWWMHWYLVNCCKNRKIKQRFNTQTQVISLQKKKRDCRKENISLNDRRNININPIYTKNFPFIFSNIKVSHDQCIIRTNMVASNRTVGQTSSDFIISWPHWIMHCKYVFGYWTFVWFIDFYSSWQDQGPYTV